MFSRCIKYNVRNIFDYSETYKSCHIKSPYHEKTTTSFLRHLSITTYRISRCMIEFVFILNVNNGERITYICTIILFRDSTVVGTSALRLGQPRNPGSIPANRVRDRFFYESVQTGCRVLPVSSSLGSESPSCWSHATHPQLLPIWGIKCSCVSTLPFVCVAGIGTTVPTIFGINNFVH
jgi:hypothetical protein